MLRFFLDSSSSSLTTKTQSTNELHQQQQETITFDIDDKCRGNNHSTKTSSSSLLSNDQSPTPFNNVTSPTVLLKYSKHKKNEKIVENLLWNLSVIKTELDNLNLLSNECESYFGQVCNIFK